MTQNQTLFLLPFIMIYVVTIIFCLALSYRLATCVPQTSSPSAKNACSATRKRNTLIVPRHRGEIGALLEELRFETGAELGVQKGGNAAQLLRSWPSCKKFYAIDVWHQQANYKDGANVGNDQQEALYKEAMQALSPWKEKTVVLRMLTREAAAIVPADSLDFVYVDARHDYCGASEDIELYWPKLRAGGIMAGHDYYMAPEVSWDDYSLCANGTKHPGAVKSAVDDFARKHRLQLGVAYNGSPESFAPSWFLLRPWSGEC